MQHFLFMWPHLAKTNRIALGGNNVEILPQQVWRR